MPFAKTLVISATPPGTRGVGEAFLREICLLCPPDSLSFFVLESLGYAMPQDTNDLKHLDIERLPMPVEQLTADSQLPVLKDISVAKKRREYWRQVEEVAQRATAYGIKQGCRQVFAVLGSPTVTAIAESVAKSLNADLICLAWDPHETTMDMLGFDAPTRKEVLKRFRSCLKNSKSLAVSSDGMRKEYLKRFGIEGVPLIRPIRSDGVKHERLRASSRAGEQIKIGFCGSFYAANEFARFFEALSEVEWKIDGKQVSFRILGNYFWLPSDFKQNGMVLELLGFREQAETVQKLSECDLLYLPFWFDEKYSLSVRTCFPDKVGTFLASGVPIFYHGPLDSTPTDFIREFPVGLSCHSLKAADILSTLTTLITDQNCRDTAWDARNLALEAVYSEKNFRKRIAQFFRVSTSDLMANENELTGISL